MILLQTSSALDIDDFEEVDLSQLEFDENIYDQQWAIKTNIQLPSTPPPSTLSHRAHSARMGRRSLQHSPVKASSQIADDSTRKEYDMVSENFEYLLGNVLI